MEPGADKGASMEAGDPGEVIEPSEGAEGADRPPKGHGKGPSKGLVIATAVIAAIALCIVVVMAVMLGVGSASLHRPYEGKGTVMHDGMAYRFNESMVSVCIMGHDRGVSTEEQGQADVIMVYALDTETGESRLIVIPRNSEVEIPIYINGDLVGMEQNQICLAYAYGTDDAMSSEIVTEVASDTLYRIPLGFYYTVSMEAFVALTDEVGGVTVTALETIPGTDIREGEEVTLAGSEAFDYVRWRDPSVFESPLQRQRRQVQVLQALFEKVSSAAQANPLSMLGAYDALSPYATTDLGSPEVLYLLSVFASKGIRMPDVISLEGRMVEAGEYQEYVLDEDQVLRTVLDTYFVPEG